MCWYQLGTPDLPVPIPLPPMDTVSKVVPVTEKYSTNDIYTVRVSPFGLQLQRGNRRVIGPGVVRPLRTGVGRTGSIPTPEEGRGGERKMSDGPNLGLRGRELTRHTETVRKLKDTETKV